MPVEIFCCYARQDEALLNKLKTHLSPLQREGLIDVWHDRNISAGILWEQEISQHLNSAHIILLLVSPDFMASDYCYSVEMKRAIERHERKEARVIPIILRPVHWQDTPLGSLQALPTDGKPITTWRRRDDAYWDIINGIKKLVKLLLAQQWRDGGYLFYRANQYAKALHAYNQAIQLDPTSAETYFQEGNTLFALKQYDEARVDYEQAIYLESDEPLFHLAKAVALTFLQQYEEALTLVEKAISLDTEYLEAYECKYRVLVHLERFQEAEEIIRKIGQIVSELKIPFV